MLSSRPPELRSPVPDIPPGRRKFICIVCGLVFEEEHGDPDSGIAPGTLWEDIPATWRCPTCRVGKADFEPFAG